jgi:selenocysteine lyase/cysteine desulfurase
VTSNSLEKILCSETARRAAFPVVQSRIFLAHAGVTALPRCAADALIEHTRASSHDHQEFGSVMQRVANVRKTAARLIEAKPEEVALIGPTSLGLSLVANGIDWRDGDEILCYHDDYPANVYPWMDLQRRGVALRFLQPRELGRITPDLVAAQFSPRTRLVALASCHYLTGWRIDVDEIGRRVHEHGALFCLDAIQSLGAFPVSVRHVDFLSADSHKWMLGPLTAGIFFVKSHRFNELRPSLIGAWNAYSPDFVAQHEVTFPQSARRYEPGVLNIGPLFGMQASLEMLMDFGIPTVATRLLELRRALFERLAPLGFEMTGPPLDDPLSSGIATFSHRDRDLRKDFATLEASGIIVSLRLDRVGRQYLRFSPHCYNTEEELDRVAQCLS